MHPAMPLDLGHGVAAVGVADQHLPDQGLTVWNEEEKIRVNFDYMIDADYSTRVLDLIQKMSSIVIFHYDLKGIYCVCKAFVHDDKVLVTVFCFSLFSLFGRKSLAMLANFWKTV